MSPKRKKDKELREVYDLAMQAKTQEQADECLDKVVAAEKVEGRRSLAEKIARRNIGYWTGYFDEQTARRVWRLYKTQHPVFGKKWPTPDEALKIGLELGEKTRKRSR